MVSFLEVKMAFWKIQQFRNWAQTFELFNFMPTKKSKNSESKLVFWGQKVRRVIYVYEKKERHIHEFYLDKGGCYSTEQIELESLNMMLMDCFSYINRTIIDTLRKCHFLMKYLSRNLYPYYFVHKIVAYKKYRMESSFENKIFRAGNSLEKFPVLNFGIF